MVTNPFVKGVLNLKKSNLWSSNAISLVEAVRAVISSDIMPILYEFLNCWFYNKPLLSFIKYQVGKRFSDGKGPALD